MSEIPERTDLSDLLELPGFDRLERLAAELREGGAVSAGGLWGSSQALVLAGLDRRVQGPWLVITSSETEAEAFAEDLQAFGVEALQLPARESYSSRGAEVHADAQAVRGRLQVAQRLAGPPERRPRRVVASLLSLLQPLPSPERMQADLLSLQVHQRLDSGKLLERLVHSGYARQPLVEVPGEVSLRGDILDLFPFAADVPLRVELFDEEIESLRSFDPESQRSIESFSQVRVELASDAGGVEDGDGVQPVSLLAPTALVVEVEPLRIEDAAGGLRIQSSSHQRALMLLEQALEGRRRLALQTLPGDTLDFDARSVQSLAVGIPQVPPALREATLDGTRALVLCSSEAERHRLGEVLGNLDGLARVELRLGSLASGFRLPELRLLVVHHRELAGVAGPRRRQRTKVAHHSRVLQSFFELRPADLVVHAVHGLARFLGLATMRRGDGEEEHLHLVFADEVSLFVPASRVDLVQRYIGTGSATPKLDKIGGQAFRKRRDKVERALRDLAAELLEVQARRAMQRRDPWPADDDLVADLIGSFPFQETGDQLQADGEIAADLRSERPLDRLLCGDVGFGKTELAVRAAFRVVNGGGQVAVLVPTTVLAQQHERTFRERLADFPVSVESVSRYATPARLKDTLQRLEEGAVDIVVGTHRLLSKDVRFARLGLVVVDEEQRFGVTHKEHFKSLRATVDVLTLSATPIPRTLHMSLSGVRDISALAEPPPGRQEIETRLAYRNDDELLRKAILREKNRGGQVFFLHNRVSSIGPLARRLAELCPECTFAVGHGQMGARELQRVMGSFTRGDADVLVATTIVENGIDIPSAGTILIDEADRFGLSELHQLRGRVGRGSHQAYCYLLLEKHKPLRRVARERLKAVEEMNHLGAGFGISMKDLEIRGAGNLLGPEQSGHIAAIGYDMYCRLLKNTVERLQGEPAGAAPAAEVWTASGVEPGVDLELGLRAFLPEKWIPDPTERIELLRRLDETDSPESVARAAEELRDRYGRLPPEAEALVRTFRVRARLEPLGITRLAWREGTWLVEFADRVVLEGALGGAAELRPLRAGRALIVAPDDAGSPASALDWLEGLLSVNAEGSRIADAAGTTR